jgi:hypothetical protein
MFDPIRAATNLGELEIHATDVTTDDTDRDRLRTYLIAALAGWVPTDVWISCVDAACDQTQRDAGKVT